MKIKKEGEGTSDCMHFGTHVASLHCTSGAPLHCPTRAKRIIMKVLGIFLAGMALCVLVQSNPIRSRSPPTASRRGPGRQHGGYGNPGGYGNQQDKKTCFQHFGPGRDFTVHDGVGHFDVKSAYCGGDSRDSGTCNVLPVKLFEQSESTSKLQGTCKGRDFENFELCKAIKSNNCVADPNTGALKCSSCCAGDNSWLNKWHLQQDSHRNQVKYRVSCDQKRGYTYDILRMDKNMGQWVPVQSNWAPPPPSGVTLRVDPEFETSNGNGGHGGGHGGGGGGVGGGGNHLVHKRRRLLQAGTSS